MLKKAALIGILLVPLDLFMVSSCCPDSILDHTSITKLKVSNSDLNRLLTSGETVGTNSFRLVLQIDLEFIAQQKSWLNAPLYATSCETMGLKGLKNKLSAISITCNHELFGIPSGESLATDDLVMAYIRGFIDDAKNTRIPLEELISTMNDPAREQSRYYWHLEFQNDIVSDELLSFEVILTFDDLTEIKAIGLPVKVE